MRYAYVKNGDAVLQVQRYLAGERSSGAGPDAFIGDFLDARNEDDLLVLSRWEPRKCLRSSHWTAVSLRVPRRGVLGIPVRVWTTLHVLLRLIKWRPDRILCGCTGDLLWAATLASAVLRVPLVNSRHNEIRKHGVIGSVEFMLDRLCIRSATGVACHGPFLAQQMRDLGLPNERIYEFEVDLNEFAAKPVVQALPESCVAFYSRFERVLLFVGRVQADKGVFDLLEAFETLDEKHKRGVGLAYVGEGMHLMMLKEKIKCSPAADRILVAGHLPHASLSQAIERAFAVITPTRPQFPEGRCMVVLESLVKGVPVLAPNFGPFPYAISQGKNGLLFQPGNMADLRNSIQRILTDAVLYDRLRSGASEFAHKLVCGAQRFAVAVDRAFTPAERGGKHGKHR